MFWICSNKITTDESDSEEEVEVNPVRQVPTQLEELTKNEAVELPSEVKVVQFSSTRKVTDFAHVHTFAFINF